MPLTRILTVRNISHEIGEPKAFSIEGSSGSPSLKLSKLSSASVDLYHAQFDEKFADTLYDFATKGFVEVFLNGTQLTLDQIGELKYSSAGFAGTDQYVKVGLAGTPDFLSETYFTRGLGTHIEPIQKINDLGAGLNDLWSGDKLDTEISSINIALGTKADADHVHFTNPRVVFKEEFIGNGIDTTFTLTGTILNGTFTTGSWSVARVLTTFPSDITGLDSKPTYDSTNIFTRHRISTVSVNALGVVTLDYAPRNGIHFYLWYWYEIQDGDVVDDYIREDYVADMEETADVIAEEVQVDTSGFSGILGVADTNTQLALDTLDAHSHDGLYPSGGTSGQVLVKDSATDFDVKWYSMILYGVGDPPSAVGIDNGTIYVKYIP